MKTAPSLAHLVSDSGYQSAIALNLATHRDGILSPIWSVSWCVVQRVEKFYALKTRAHTHARTHILLNLSSSSQSSHRPTQMANGAVLAKSEATTRGPVGGTVHRGRA